MRCGFIASRRLRGHRILTLDNIAHHIRSLPVARQPILDPDTRLKLPLQKVNLVREENDGCLCEQLRRDDIAPEKEGILETVHALVFLKLFIKT
jgi:hypothetical protein